MIIDFKNIQGKAIPSFKGGIGDFNAKIFDDSAVKILFGALPTGATIGYHTHDDSAEIIYILGGEGKLIFDNEKIKISAGDVHYCPKDHAHSLINDSDGELSFFAVVPKL